MNAAAAVPPAVLAACAGVHDPEFGLSIVDLGLIVGATVADRKATVAMTLTTPSCPAGEVIAEAVRSAVAALPEVDAVAVEFVWEPPWTPERITPAGRRRLGWADQD